MTFKITVLYEKKWSGFSSLGRDGFFSLVCYRSVSSCAMAKLASLMAILGLDGGKKPKEVPL